ncbi:hypothetical protein [Flavobacterium sp. LB2P53]|nr:hypothetical protein [Flavobacterium sp. LB2P53]
MARAMGGETKMVSPHSSNEVLKKYLDPKLPSVIANGTLEIKIFG